MGCQKASARGTFVAINAMLKTKRKETEKKMYV